MELGLIRVTFFITGLKNKMDLICRRFAVIPFRRRCCRTCYRGVCKGAVLAGCTVCGSCILETVNPWEFLGTPDSSFRNNKKHPLSSSCEMSFWCEVREVWPERLELTQISTLLTMTRRKASQKEQHDKPWGGRATRVEHHMGFRIHHRVQTCPNWTVNQWSLEYLVLNIFLVFINL